MYKGRKKKTIEYFAIKSVDKSQRSKILQEVSEGKPDLNYLSFDFVLFEFKLDLEAWIRMMWDFTPSFSCWTVELLKKKWQLILKIFEP